MKNIRFEIKFLPVLAVLGFTAFFGVSVLTSPLYPPSSSPNSGSGTRTQKPGLLQVVPDAPKSALTGTNLTGGLQVDQPIGVMIENYTPIRNTQKGVEDAAIVYESLTEGGITRLLCIFSGEPVDSIGPVRSARPYFIDWAGEYKAAYTHVGGSFAALENLKTNPFLLNLDEFSDESVIWRSSLYLAPHNAFTSVSNVLRAMKEKGFFKPLESPRFIFKKPAPATPVVKLINIPFSIDPYEVKWVYLPGENSYARYNGGKPHGRIKAANILVQFTEQETLDDIGRLRIQTLGTGRALIFNDGKAIKGTWEKEDAQSFTRFFDEGGQEVPLNPGQTWVEVVPSGLPITY